MMNIGLIGCGNISSIYQKNSKLFSGISLKKMRGYEAGSSSRTCRDHGARNPLGSPIINKKCQYF